MVQPNLLYEGMLAILKSRTFRRYSFNEGQFDASSGSFGALYSRSIQCFQRGAQLFNQRTEVGYVVLEVHHKANELL